MPLPRPHHHHPVAVAKTVPSPLVRKRVASSQQSASSQVSYSRLFLPHSSLEYDFAIPTFPTLHFVLFCFSFLGLPTDAIARSNYFFLDWYFMR